MECGIENCPGDDEERDIVHVERHDDQPVVVDHVPALVCSVCGDVLFTPETVRRLEAPLRSDARPARTAPVYEYA
jgi:YgiT-type zinc finger domain-containing protein